ncbi:hypothetical protein PGT21_031269 [Puccinia graminis f. sp. tritici]|uniref:Uncharacterized protein n=1 Tax=Puccinia graminis f. sp. tritici TaxID=56615 RepID=A0A5B0NAI2_PUCGR|nr:hypothetical protein PGT21_031269 [Puccinia graminis f. sp. tritici]KAA1086295.1 hypothetical protein PGTUg99_006028 [Puccinia graminis f. sp. tritici]
MQARFPYLSLWLVFYLNSYEVGSNILNFHDAGGSAKRPKELELSTQRIPLEKMRRPTTPKAFDLSPLQSFEQTRSEDQEPKDADEELQLSKRPRPMEPLEEYHWHAEQHLLSKERPSIPGLTTSSSISATVRNDEFDKADRLLHGRKEALRADPLNQKETPALHSAFGNVASHSKHLTDSQPIKISSGESKATASQNRPHLESSSAQSFRGEITALATGREGKEIQTASHTVSPVEDLQVTAWSLFPGNEQVKEQYSCQTLDWTPLSIDENIALVSYILVHAFHAEIPHITLNHLKTMQNSHTIFVPFIYRLLTKPLTTHNWSRILVFWRVFWNGSAKHLEKTDLSTSELLGKFMWITDFISESTIPELFDNLESKLSHMQRQNLGFRLSNDEARIMRFLSDGRYDTKITSAQRKIICNLSKLSNEECVDRDSYSESAQQLVLERLESLTQTINSKLLGIRKELENIESSKLNSFFHTFEEVLLKKKEYNLDQAMRISGFSDSFQRKILGILQKRTSDEKKLLLYSSSEECLNTHDPFLIKQFDTEITKSHQGFNDQPDIIFLPQRIHNLIEKLKKVNAGFLHLGRIC